MPVQAALLSLSKSGARRLPRWYHRNVCRILGVRLAITGNIISDQPVLVVANHASWLDIIVISAVAPVSFVAKKEVASWPVVATLARLQRTVFVDRERRSKIGDTATEIMGRLGDGDAIVLFAEGTSSDGNRVLGFKTSLFAAVKPTIAPGKTTLNQAVVQTVTVVYTRKNGLPLGWAGRRELGYYGDIGMGANAWAILTGGPIAATLAISEPISLDSFKDRKALASWAEREVRSGFIAALRS
jgi:lyso-ornithine lipid O-acyltransferase